MSNLLEQKYTRIIAALRQGQRFHEKIDARELEQIKLNLKDSTDRQKLIQSFCLLDNTPSTHSELEDLLVQFIENHMHDIELLVMAIDACRRHIIAGKQKDGIRLDYNFLKLFEQLLEHREPEVIEWTLRAIAECGGQAIFFREKLQQIKPSFVKMYNKHFRAVREIIEFMERDWRMHEARLKQSNARRNS